MFFYKWKHFLHMKIHVILAFRVKLLVCYLTAQLCRQHIDTIAICIFIGCWICGSSITWCFKLCFQVVGLRKDFSSVEKLTRDNVMLRREESLVNSPNGRLSNRHSDLSGNITLPLACTCLWFQYMHVKFLYTYLRWYLFTYIFQVILFNIS